MVNLGWRDPYHRRNWLILSLTPFGWFSAPQVWEVACCQWILPAGLAGNDYLAEVSLQFSSSLSSCPWSCLSTLTTQQQHPRSTQWAGQQPPKRSCNRVREIRPNKEEKEDEEIIEHKSPTVVMPQHHLSNPKTYSEYKMQKIQKKLWEIANPERENEERRTRSYSEESRPSQPSGHSHNNHA